MFKKILKEVTSYLIAMLEELEEDRDLNDMFVTGEVYACVETLEMIQSLYLSLRSLGLILI